MKKLVLVGAGGHCVSCLDVIAAARRDVEGVLDVDRAAAPDALRWLGGDDWIEGSDAAGFEFLVTVGQVGTADARRALHDRIVAAARPLATVVSPHALVVRRATIGAGSIVMHRAVVNTEAEVGVNCIVNTNALVEHHASIGAHTHVATGAIVNGGARIGEGCLVGSGAIVLQGVSVAEGTVIGAGAVVDKDIGEPGTWVGVPARRVR